MTSEKGETKSVSIVRFSVISFKRPVLVMFDLATFIY